MVRSVVPHRALLALITSNAECDRYLYRCSRVGFEPSFLKALNGGIIEHFVARGPEHPDSNRFPRRIIQIHKQYAASSEGKDRRRGRRPRLRVRDMAVMREDETSYENA